jgi:non-heme chloroperoxidase
MAIVTVGTENATPVGLYYEDHGAGRPVVLVHGWPLSSRSWEAQIPALVEAGHRVISYDRRGFGASSQPWTGYDYGTLAADLNVLLEHLDLTDATLVGFSMGGGEVVRYLATYGSARISRAVLIAAVPPYLYRSDDNPEGGLDDATIGGFEAAVRTDRLAFLDEFITAFFTAGSRSDLVSEPLRRYHVAMAAAASPKGTLECISAFGRTDFRKELGAVTVPTLIVHGDSDAVVPFEVSGRRTHETIAGSRLVLVRAAPHGLTVTHADQVNRALLEFIAD